MDPLSSRSHWSKDPEVDVVDASGEPRWDSSSSTGDRKQSNGMAVQLVRGSTGGIRSGRLYLRQRRQADRHDSRSACLAYIYGLICVPSLYLCRLDDVCPLLSTYFANAAFALDRYVVFRIVTYIKQYKRSGMPRISM